MPKESGFLLGPRTSYTYHYHARNFGKKYGKNNEFIFHCLTPFCEQPMVSSFEMSRLHCFPKFFRLAVAVVGPPSQHLRSSWNNVHRVHRVCHWLRARHGQGQQVRVFVDVGTSCGWESAEPHVAPAAGLIWRTGMALQVCPVLFLLSECRRMTSWTKRNMAWTAKKWTSGRVVQICCLGSFLDGVSCMLLFLYSLILHSLFLRYSFVWSVGCPVIWSFGHSVTPSIGHWVQSYYSSRAMRMYLQFLFFMTFFQERLPSSLVPEPRLIDSVLKPEKPNLEGAMECCVVWPI